MKFTINIGLLNNPCTAPQIAKHFQEKPGYTVVKYKVESGSYHEAIEPTIVMQLDTAYTLLSKVIKDIEDLCSVFTQEYIAVQSNSFELLVYNINYCGNQDKFDSDYFLTI